MEITTYYRYMLSSCATPGRLVPIEEEIQVLPDKLVGTQVAFELAEEDRPPSYE